MKTRANVNTVPDILDQFLIGAYTAAGEVTCDRQAVDDWCQPLRHSELCELARAIEETSCRDPYPYEVLNRYWYFKTPGESRKWLLKVGGLVADCLREKAGPGFS